MFLLPQVKRYLMSSIISFVYNTEVLMILTWKNLSLTEKIHGNTRLAAPDGFHINQLSPPNPIIAQMPENATHQVYSKNEWLLLSVTFTAKIELVFVLTFENAFS